MGGVLRVCFCCCWIHSHTCLNEACLSAYLLHLAVVYSFFFSEALTAISLVLLLLFVLYFSTLLPFNVYPIPFNPLSAVRPRNPSRPRSQTSDLCPHNTETQLLIATAELSLHPPFIGLFAIKKETPP